MVLLALYYQNEVVLFLTMKCGRIGGIMNKVFEMGAIHIDGHRPLVRMAAPIFQTSDCITDTSSPESMHSLISEHFY